MYDLLYVFSQEATSHQVPDPDPEVTLHLIWIMEAL